MIFEPAGFFAGLGGPNPDRVKEPLIFAIVCGMVSVFAIFVVAPFDPLQPETPTVLDPSYISLLRESPVATIALSIGTIVLLPLLLLVGVYLVAAVQHFFVFLFVRERSGYWGTFPVVAYGSALSLFSWIPIFGYLVSIYGVYVTMVGLRELHQTSTTRALLAALVPAMFGFAWIVTSFI